MTKLRLIVWILAVATFALPRTAAAEWSERPVHFIVPFPAGGATDVAARFVGNFVSGTLGQQIVVENRSGANGPRVIGRIQRRSFGSEGSLLVWLGAGPILRQGTFPAHVRNVWEVPVTLGELGTCALCSSTNKVKKERS